MLRPNPLTLATALAVAAALSACSDSTGPSGGTLGRPLSLSQLDSVVTTGPTRLEIELVPGALEAREVHVEDDDMEEKIVSRVTAIDPVAGTLTLSLGGLVVSYNDGTRFRTPSSSDVARAAWEAAIGDAIAAGGQPPIEVRRNAPAQPQDPGDASFTATDLRLEDEAEEPKLEMYVDSDNFVTGGTPPTIATLTVLSLPIAITSSTSLHDDEGQDDGDDAEEGEFEGKVQSVDVAAGTLTLSDGRIVTVGNLTFDPEGDLFSLQAAATAVQGGSPVKAEGEGSVAEVGPPLVISATSIKVEVDD